jgi:hypothetical protein
MTKMINGTDLDGLCKLDTVNTVKRTPDLKLFKFRTNAEWKNDGYNMSKIRKFMESTKKIEEARQWT